MIIVDKLDKLFRTNKGEIQKNLTPYFYNYYRSYFDNPERFASYVGFANHMANLTQCKGKTVLDAGCGFGLTSFLLCSFGAREVVGIDANYEKLLVAHRICGMLGLKPPN